MGFAIVTLLVLLLGAFVPPAREDQCACALSNRKLQRKVGAAHQAAISERFEARAQSAKAPTAVHGSPGAPLVLENVGWLASQPTFSSTSGAPGEPWTAVGALADCARASNRSEMAAW